MTVLGKIKNLVYNQQVDLETDSWEKLVYLAYYIGREEATKEVSDKYRAHLKAQTERANACRYHNMAVAILGNGKSYIYTSDYGQEMKKIFGDDVTAL